MSPEHLRSRWRRPLWLGAGAASLLLGIAGIVVPLLPTTPFVLLAAFCFSRGCRRCEQWLLEHPRFGPSLRQWRAKRAIPLRAKQLASLMMAISCVATLLALGWPWGALPLPICAVVALWLWRLPSTDAG